MRRTDTEPGWINREFQKIRAEIRELRAAKGLQAATIGKGGITVKDGGNITILNGDGSVAWDALSGPIKPASVWGEANSGFNFTTSWTHYGLTSVAVPAGFTACQVMMMVSAGASWTGGGNLSVVPELDGALGPIVNSGQVTGGAAVAQSFWSQTIAVTPGTNVPLEMQVIAAAAPDAGTSNWHLAASLLFLR